MKKHDIFYRIKAAEEINTPKICNSTVGNGKDCYRKKLQIFLYFIGSFKLLTAILWSKFYISTNVALFNFTLILFLIFFFAALYGRGDGQLSLKERFYSWLRLRYAAWTPTAFAELLGTLFVVIGSRLLVYGFDSPNLFAESEEERETITLPVADCLYDIVADIIAAENPGVILPEWRETLELPVPEFLTGAVTAGLMSVTATAAVTADEEALLRAFAAGFCSHLSFKAGFYLYGYIQTSYFFSIESDMIISEMAVSPENASITVDTALTETVSTEGNTADREDAAWSK